MKTSNLLLLLPCVGAFWDQVHVGPGLPVGRAQLEARLQGEQLTLIGHYQNTGAESLTLRYELVTGKKGLAGTSQNSQSGRFTVEPQQTATLSQTTITVVPADYYRAKLRILNLQGSVLAEDSLVHHPAPRP